MKEQFVPYEIALKLKEKGFDEPCLGYFDPLYEQLVIWENGNTNSTSNWVYAPLWQQAIDWFEDKFNMKFSIAYWNGYNYSLPKAMQYKYEVYIIPKNGSSITVRDNEERCFFDTRKDAIVAAIIKALTLI